MCAILCKIKNCGNPVHSKGMCKKHYARVWRYGDPQRLRNKREGEGEGEGEDVKVQAGESVCALRKSLRRAKEAYEAAVGVSTRLKWRSEILLLEQHLRQCLA